MHGMRRSDAQFYPALGLRVWVAADAVGTPADTGSTWVPGTVVGVPADVVGQWAVRFGPTGAQRTERVEWTALMPRSFVGTSTPPPPSLPSRAHTNVNPVAPSVHRLTDGVARPAAERTHLFDLSTMRIQRNEFELSHGGSTAVPQGKSRLAVDSGHDPRPLIVIAGAGLGGLAAAAALQRWGARVQVYERDCSFDQRKQGYGLTMQQGGAALRALGAESLGRGCVSATLHVSFKSDGKLLGRYGHDTRTGAQKKENADTSPCTKRRKKNKRTRNFLIPRQRLRQELLDLLEPGTVRWGCKFESYEPLGSPVGGTLLTPGVDQTSEDGVTVRFSRVEATARSTSENLRQSAASSDTVHAAVLVGADGIFSQVAKQRMDSEHTRIVYTGVLVILGIVDYMKADDVLPDGKQLQDHELLRNGTTIAETVDGNTRFCTRPFFIMLPSLQVHLPKLQCIELFCCLCCR